MTRAVVASAPAFGATSLGDARTRFRLWAPDASSVEVEFDADRREPMMREADGTFQAVIDAAPGARYRYRIDGDYAVPDPASRWQPDGADGASAVFDPDAYAWQHAQWRGRPWNEAVIYELHVGTCGGYAGVRAQLPRLAALGITAIELMPVAEFAGRRNWGYDGVLPYAPASAYGTPDELKALIDEAHGLGLMVLLDVVYNHFGPAGNHLGRYASTFFRKDRASAWGESIDFNREPVRRYFIDNALMWLREYRFDGLRLDAVHAIEPTEFLDELREAIHAAVPDRHVHLVLENERNQASLLERGYTAQWNDDFHNALHVLLTGEDEAYYANYADQPAARLARVLSEGFAYQGEENVHGEPRGEPSGHLPPTKFVVFAQNHDQVGNRACGERLSTLVSERALRVAMALTALTPMIPLFFMGEPWGSRTPFLFFTDFDAPLDEAVREGRRREFATFSAFADEARRASIPDPNAPETFDASIADIADAERGDGADWAAWFRGLLEARRRHLQDRLDDAKPIGARVIGAKAVQAAWSIGDQTLRVAVNFGDEAVALGPWPAGEIVHAELPHAEAVQLCDALRVLPPCGFVAHLAPANP
ncbi:malto-oligosyltrehalose trehalohydrolase [Lysobacter auxotrophicus]|uniref:Malto-oligosyltrehalose trehalohydrolase n=1 Tax=Lysobacter auxotrophicus TaxID=2992573 RepID=A0ABM8DD58_9GAMM|nr:malto-oligosyltrehalose trehalohydrolase [Lysobacter auxotrophicus]BDU16531.1 malto-oligosyltrehalose trehalohydrolase [Lysobacter auxotrophicus]